MYLYALQDKKVLNMMILEVLEQYTDSDHRLTQQKIVELLEKNYGVPCTRQTVKNNLMLLKNMGYDISMRGGIFLKSRLFDNAELKEAKRNYKEEMKQLASKMKANGNIPGIAKWDDSLQVISIGPIGFSTIVKYNTKKGIEIIEDIKQISSTRVKGKEKRKGTFTRAAVGTLLMPGIGTLAGALTAKKESSGEKETTTSHPQMCISNSKLAQSILTEFFLVYLLTKIYRLYILYIYR